MGTCPHERLEVLGLSLVPDKLKDGLSFSPHSSPIYLSGVSLTHVSTSSFEYAAPHPQMFAGLARLA